MEIKLCRICGKQDDSYIHIFKTEGLKNKIETCLPIVVMQHYSLPDTICTGCFDTVDNFYSFIKSCLQNIIVLEAQYEIIESCLKTKRQVDRAVSVEPCDLLVPALPVSLPAEAPPCLVDYDSSSDSDDEPAASEQTKAVNPSKPSDIIDEIVLRKCLKRKGEPALPVPPVKQSRTEESSSRRKSSRPKRVEYHVEAAQACLLCDAQLSGLLALAAHMYEVHGLDLGQVYSGGPSEPPPTHKRKIPELVKISDVIGMGKLPAKLTVEVVGAQHQSNTPQPTAGDTLEITQVVESVAAPPVSTGPPEAPRPVTMSSLNDSLFLCSECPGGRRPFTSFQEFSTHRRAQHQIFHCDLCPKFYGRNSHLWKHVNRVHKGHSAVTCAECGKTSASEYHLQQHKNKMHAGHSASAAAPAPPTTGAPAAAAKESQQKVPVIEATVDEVKEESGGGGGGEEDDDEEEEEVEGVAISGDEDDLLNQKFQGFDFKSVRQSFLRQELMNKRQRYVSVLKKNNVLFDDEARAPTPPPKEIDSSSDLYTTIITNYTPPSNEGPYKCPKCLKGFHKKNLVKKHKKNCRPRLQKDLLTRCKTCSRIFKDRQSLAKHLVNYHSEYTCEVCGVAVQSKCEIVAHIRFTHPGSELQCACGQLLRCRADLARHKAEHRDSHVCQFCADQLPTKIKLKMHILSLHRKILALSCGICLRLFETQHVLRAHVKHAHADQLRPLTSCTVCGKNYGSKWKTYDHLNKSHGRIFKACKACLEVFETERDLQQHFEREHVNNGAQATVVTASPTKSPVKTSDTKKLPLLAPAPVKKLSDDEPEYETEDYGEFTEQKNGKQGQGKVSLLEKRLLGKKTNVGDVGADYEGGDDILQNSSKRTVYVNSNDPSLCEICLKVWPAKKHLWQHYIRCHKATAATVCGICLKTNPSYSALQRHLRDTHPRLLHGQGFGSNFICKICGRYHNASSKLRLHMAIHVGYNAGSAASATSAEEEEDIKMDVEEPQMDVHVIKNEIKEEVEEEDEQTLNEEAEEYEVKSERSPHSSNEEDNGADEDDDDESEAEDDDDDEGEENEPDEDDDDDETSEPDASDPEQGAEPEPLTVKSEAPDEDDVYYESLIEEVEASDEDDEEDDDGDDEGDDEDDVEEVVLEEEEEEEEGDLEREMLRNMVCESRAQRLLVGTAENGQTFPAAVKEEAGDSEPEGPPDELDSAIRSICGEDEDEDAAVGLRYRRIQRVNESELETAVGSIL